MGRFILARLLTAAVVGCSTVVWAAGSPRYDLRKKPVFLDLQSPSTTAPVRPTPQTIRAIGAATSPGYIMGYTYYDLQQYGTLGRQIDVKNNNIMISWTLGFSPSSSPRYARFMQNALTGSASPYMLDDGSSIRIYPLAIPLDYTVFGTPGGGFTNTRASSTFQSTVVYHGRPDIGPPGPVVSQVDTSDLAFERFVETIVPQPAGSQHVDDPVLWAKQALSVCGSDEIMHVVGTSPGNGGEIWYWRGLVTTTAPYVAWDPPVYLADDAWITAAVEAHGSEVTVAYIADNGNHNFDVMYIRSTDCGLTWQAPVNVTNYAADGPEGAYTELAMAYDPGGGLHIIWNTIPPDGSVVPSNLYHWSATTGIRLITQAGWVNDCGYWWQWPPKNNGAGFGNTALSDPGLTIKPAGMGPGAGIADELIYATWTQFGPTTTDCATLDDVGTTGGYVNGEIYWSVSSDGGATWDRPTTVTGTHTPDCLPGDCSSETWQTVAALADSAVYMAYVDDTHAGAAPLSEGVWSNNPYCILALETRLPVPSPQIFVWPVEFRDLYVDNLGSTDSVAFQVYNTGNGSLDFQVDVMADDDGLSHVTVHGGNSYSSSIPAGGPSEKVTVLFDGVGIPDYTEKNWRLELTSNDSLNDPGQGGTPIDITLQVFVAPEWYTCNSDTISTGQHRLQVSSCLELGNQELSGGGLYNYADSTEWLYTGSPVITWLEGGATKRAYRNAYMTSADRNRELNQSFRSIAPLVVSRDGSADRASGSAVTTDSLIQMDYEIIAFMDPFAAQGAVARYVMANRTTDTLSGVSYGALVDFDVTGDSAWESTANIGFANEQRDMIGMQAVSTDSTGIVAYFSHYAALFHVEYGLDCNAHAAAGQVMDNWDYAYPYSPPYPTDSLYDLFDRFGQRGGLDGSTYNSGGQDTASDLSALMVTRYKQDLAPSDSIAWGFGVAVSDLSFADLVAQVDAIRLATGIDCPPPACGAPYSGDVNQNCAVNSADIIYLIAYLFKGGPLPQYTVETGDVNCSGDVTSADVIFLVNYVFKGGPAPPESCP